MSGFTPAPFSTSGDEFGELIWDNGQIMIRDRQNRSPNLLFFSGPQVKDGGRDAARSKTALLCEMGGGAFVDGRDDEDTVPWTCYQPEDPCRNDHLESTLLSDFLEEFAGAGAGYAAGLPPPSSSQLSSVTDIMSGVNVDGGVQPAVVNFSLFSLPSSAQKATASKSGVKAKVVAPAADGTVVVTDLDSPASGSKNAVALAMDGRETVPPSLGSSFQGSWKDSGERGNGEDERKARDAEESSSNKDDIDPKDEFTRVKRNKRNRAAEVHNLSERRRRERINEKMRTLQEMIPNCNKADKASMLEDAIEYIKALQLQLQMMSAGGGMYLSPVMLPQPPQQQQQQGMQQVRPPSLVHFSPMSGGLATGYGLGVYDMHGSVTCPVIPLPPIYHPLSGSLAMHGMFRPAASRPQQVFGLTSLTGQFFQPTQSSDQPNNPSLQKPGLTNNTETTTTASILPHSTSPPQVAAAPASDEDKPQQEQGEVSKVTVTQS